jgi:hypothetical protein
MASGIYNRFKANLLEGKCNLSDESAADVIRVALLDDNHSFSATDNVWADVSANELPLAGGYVPIGQVLGNQAVTQAASTKWDADDISWADATFTAYHAVMYDDSLDDDDLILSIDFGGAKTVSSGTFTIQWHANGILTLAEAA